MEKQMENLLKLTLTNPMNFDFNRLLGALALSKEKFSIEKSQNKTTVLYDDKMQMVKQRSALSQSPYNYIPFVSFDIVDENKIKSIELGSQMRFNILSRYMQRGNIPEFQILKKFADKSIKRLHDGVDLIADAKKIQYAVPQKNNKLIASVYQSHYAFANGPKGTIDYLGTRGIATCIGLAMVAKKENKNPHVIVMHLDARNNISGSIDDAIATLKENNQEISAYIVGDKKERVDESILFTFNTLQEKGIKTQLDLSDDRLIINLKSGLPVRSLRTTQEEWLEPSPQLENALEKSILTFTFSATKGLIQNAKKEYDLMTGPSGYIRKYIAD
jgi:hypothetical protein